jgi:hypothetical protein
LYFFYRSPYVSSFIIPQKWAKYNLSAIVSATEKEDSRPLKLQTKLFLYRGRVRETDEFPEWNPQAEFSSAEENSEFQGFLADGTHLFILLSKQVEILIST